MGVAIAMDAKALTPRRMVTHSTVQKEYAHVHNKDYYASSQPPMPRRQRKDSVDDLGGVMSRFEAPLAVKDIRGTLSPLPPKALRQVVENDDPTFSVLVKTFNGREYNIEGCTDNMPGLEFMARIMPETELVIG